MKGFFKALGLVALLLGAAIPTHAKNSGVPQRVLGKASAPITVEEYVSFTCPHCAEFYEKTLPELEKRYADTGKVKFILRDFPTDGRGLKAAQLSRCMPEEQYHPFVRLLFKNQMTWVVAPDPEKILLSYARLGGLPEDKAKACLADTELQDALITVRGDATEKFGIESTPTFIINNGAERIKGAQPAAEFAKIFDRLLAAKQ
ncbi:MAG: DsbA family protein [Alphaproteobacteria bacterium]|nr:DsbA family protein [Alphaproteobacteria bacterium]